MLHSFILQFSVLNQWPLRRVAFLTENINILAILKEKKRKFPYYNSIATWVFWAASVYWFCLNDHKSFWTLILLILQLEILTIYFLFFFFFKQWLFNM